MRGGDFILAFVVIYIDEPNWVVYKEKTTYILQQFNSVNDRLKFIMEVETISLPGKLPFLYTPTVNKVLLSHICILSLAVLIEY